uniref:Uncharacterized protein n=1 Tax=Anguilla anguilla TaxID=7936 RepID=A0A0E9QIP8_ANGAN
MTVWSVQTLDLDQCCEPGL